MKIIYDVLNVQEDSGEGLRQGKRALEQPEACDITHVVVVHKMEFPLLRIDVLQPFHEVLDHEKSNLHDMNLRLTVPSAPIQVLKFETNLKFRPLRGKILSLWGLFYENAKKQKASSRHFDN